MMLGAPTFIDKTGYFPLSIDTEFQALNDGLEAIRSRLGEERYRTLAAMSQRMRALFEGDPEGHDRRYSGRQGSYRRDATDAHEPAEARVAPLGARRCSSGSEIYQRSECPSLSGRARQSF
ncbi:hypothetical protein [Sphingomonas sp.]|uniref:hypothetical protein n=1 Tax=Sphingomonas sp. TaxID=28214 RepID=UPI003B008BE2